MNINVIFLLYVKLHKCFYVLKRHSRFFVYRSVVLRGMPIAFYKSTHPVYYREREYFWLLRTNDWEKVIENWENINAFYIYICTIRVVRTGNRTPK